MRLAVAMILAFCSVPIPASAGQRRNTFRVGAVVVRSSTVRATPARLSFAAKGPVLVAIDGAPPRLVDADLALPPGTVRVTIQY